MRRHLSWFAVAWLVCQALALAAAPFVLAATTATTADGFVVCDCPGALPGQACPMHHPEHTAPKSSGFLLQNPCAPTSAALFLMAGGIGVPGAGVDVAGLVELPGEVAPTLVRIAGRVSVPDAPPPRNPLA